ncbi:MAG TPA: hypothetical protein VNZ64_05570 [Candidatus Acidoferrum sp.]|nr:hypothetical protein [Candidatus Acidoferrum sp.]
MRIPPVTGQWWRAERGCLSRSIPDQSAVAGRFGAVIYLVAAAAETAALRCFRCD